MIKYSLLVLTAILASSQAGAFPTGSFECGASPRTVAFDISNVVVGSETMPFVSVRIRQPDLESDLKGVGLLLQVTDKKSGEIERAVVLPGTNFRTSYSKNDEIGFVSTYRDCRRI